MRISKAVDSCCQGYKVFLRKRYTLYSLVVFPVIIGIGLPFVLYLVISRQGALLSTQHLTDLMNAFSFFFAIGASAIPTLLASYSLVGEKVEKSLEPLLAATHHGQRTSSRQRYRRLHSIHRFPLHRLRRLYGVI